ncbi:MAG: hypothetical protein M1816_004492 [Peltula sp. TS41687]|nr:MAG: hypothetical protein M1816_004492 [Peltula sp. TS41687]
MDKTAGLPSPARECRSSLLSKAMDRYRSELKDGADFILEVDSVEELLNQAKALQPQSPRIGKHSASLSQLEPILSQINDFAALIALYSGADAKATGLVWGSLRLILTLATPAGDTLNDVLDMLNDLSLALPRFRAYEETLPMDQALESSLLEVYTEMTCFFARTINFFRNNPHHYLIRNAWVRLQGDFGQTIKRLKHLSQSVDMAAEALRLRTDDNRNTELLTVMESFKENKTKDEVLPCYYLPFGINERFYGREVVLKRVHELLDPHEGDFSGRSLTLHGMGGVGKTKIALQYANESRDRFDAIFWISVDTTIKMTQDFVEIAQRLGLMPEQDLHDTVAATAKVKSWLGETRCRWLLVLDNANDPEILRNVWPNGAIGSILLTSRNFAAAFEITTQSYHVQPFDESAGISTLLSLVRCDPQSPSNQAAAKQITRALGGLPLAINQVSGFIVQQKLALKDFLPLYERNSAKIDARKWLTGQYDTLSTVWELAFSQLSGGSNTLQTLLAFLDPDKIHESVLLEGGSYVQDDSFSFLKDEMDFLDAKEPLLRAALIDRNSDNATLTIHRLVQAAILKRLSTAEKVKYYDYAITMLSNGFPNTWNTVTSHQFTAWTKCEKCLPHVIFLVAQAERYQLHPTEPEAYAELIFRCCWYLYERESYHKAEGLIYIGIRNLARTDTLLYASASMLLGLIELDLNNLQKALDCFAVALKIREKLLDADDAFIASSLNALSLAYTELEELEQAVATQQRAIDIRLRTNSDRIGNSYSNMASTLLRMAKADAAEEMLKKCPALKDFTDETFLSTGNPRFSGDMVLLSRIRQRQGRLDDALRLSSKALAFRQKLLGNKLKTCDSLYQVATLLQMGGDSVAARNLLEECVFICEQLPEADGHLARANYKLTEVYASLHDEERSQNCRQAAQRLRRKIVGDVAPMEESEDSYNRLVPWMLW